MESEIYKTIVEGGALTILSVGVVVSMIIILRIMLPHWRDNVKANTALSNSLRDTTERNCGRLTSIEAILQGMETTNAGILAILRRMVPEVGQGNEQAKMDTDSDRDLRGGTPAHPGER